MILNAAIELDNMRVPPNNRLERIDEGQEASTLYSDQRSIPDLLRLEYRKRI